MKNYLPFTYNKFVGNLPTISRFVGFLLTQVLPTTMICRKLVGKLNYLQNFSYYLQNCSIDKLLISYSVFLTEGARMT